MSMEARHEEYQGFPCPGHVRIAANVWGGHTACTLRNHADNICQCLPHEHAPENLFHELVTNYRAYLGLVDSFQLRPWNQEPGETLQAPDTRTLKCNNK
jgi:hypothetical protein